MSKYQRFWLLICQVWALQDCGMEEKEIIEACFEELDALMPVRKGRKFDSRERGLAIRFHGTVGNYFMRLREVLPASLLNQFRLGILNSRSKDRKVNISRATIQGLSVAKHVSEERYKERLAELESQLGDPRPVPTNGEVFKALPFGDALRYKGMTYTKVKFGNKAYLSDRDGNVLTPEKVINMSEPRSMGTMYY